MPQLVHRPGSLLARRQPLGILPSGWFWTDEMAEHVRWLTYPAAFGAGVVAGLAGASWALQILAAVATGQLVLGAVERLIRRRLRRRALPSRP